jgi:AcrR family transcriptional regulator
LTLHASDGLTGVPLNGYDQRMQGRVPRRYELRKRAERQAETRRRIVDAALELYGQVGPIRTTVSAIATRAGVQRLTVYRHFPDESALLTACSDDLFVLHPLPDMNGWFTERQPATRLLRALGDLYAWYRATDPIGAGVLRDAPELPALQAGLRPLTDPLAELPAALSEGWPTFGPNGRGLLAGVIGHALEVTTWQSLAGRREWSDERAAGLLVAAARSAAREES